MLVVTRVGDGKADLVQASRPGQQAPPLLAIELPALGDLFQGAQGRVLDAARLFGVQMVTLAQGPDRAVAHVLLADATDEIVEQTLAQGRAGRSHLFDLETLEDRAQDGDAAGEDR